MTNSIDASVILQYDAGLASTLGCLDNADANGDGHVNSLDASIILQFDAGLISHIGPPVTATPTRTHTPTPTRTPTRTATHTSTPVTTPTSTPPPGCDFAFASYHTEPDELCGVVTSIARQTSILASSFYDKVTAPDGMSFVVVFMTVTNFSSSPHDVGWFSLRLKDSLTRIFTMDYPQAIAAQWNTQSYSHLNGLYATLQPGVSDNMVFVFLAPTDATGFTAERCPLTGCEQGGPAPPPPTCTLSFASYYGEPHVFCGVVTSIAQRTTIPASPLYDAVTAPDGTNFVVVFMTVTNFSSSPHDVGWFSLRLRDGTNRTFTMDYPQNIAAQWNTQSYSHLNGLYATLQPGVSDNMVFVFLTPTDATAFTAESCPTGECG